MTVKTKKKTSKKSSAKKPKPSLTIEPKAIGWAALELTPRGESEKNIQYLVDLIKKNIGNDKAEVFVPIYYQNEEFYEKNVSLFEGYFFIKHLPGVSYAKLKDSKYFEGVVCDPRSNEVQLIPDSQIQDLQKKFNDILKKASILKKGQRVMILDGLYKNLTATITKVIKDKKVCILELTCLKSRKITISEPFMSLSVVDDGDNDSTIVKFFS